MSPRLLLIPAAAFALIAAESGNPPNRSTGKELFGRRCTGCHALDSNRTGPRLRGVLRRKAGSVEDFPYSESLRKAGFLWDERLLNQWLENTDAVVKDNDMEFSVANAAERAAIVAYLKSLSE